MRNFPQIIKIFLKTFSQDIIFMVVIIVFSFCEYAIKHPGLKHPVQKSAQSW